MNTTYYRRPKILASPELTGGHTVIEASAGTGKTYTLEHLVLDLIINDRAKIEEILVVTFTDAATRELRERIRSLIRKICDEGSLLPPDSGDAGNYWEVNEATRSRLQEALFRFDGAAISTIHGFCHRILSEQAFLGGRLFIQEHADGSELFGFAFREEVRTTLVEDSPVGDALRLWIEENRSVHDLQSLLYFCHREGSPERCPVTPLWDPDGFIKTVGKLPQKEDLITAGESFFDNKTTARGYNKLFCRLDETITAIRNASEAHEAFMLFSEWADYQNTINGDKQNQLDHIYRASKMAGAPAELVNLAATISRLALRAAVPESIFVYELLPRVQARLTARKRSLGLIDYDDMLLGVKEALTGPDAGVLLDVLRRRWKYALVDEFQDTDPVQWEIFRLIFVEGGSEHRLFVIGDPKQAIYGFRGADVYTYELAKNYLVNKCGAARLPLTKNYRSTKTLIEAVNDILTAEDSEGNGFFNGLNRYDHPISCGNCDRSAFEGGKAAVPVHLIHPYSIADQKLTSARLRRGISCFIAEEIIRLTDPQSGLFTTSGGDQLKPVRLNDIYILTRSGREGKQIGEVLRRYGLPHAFYKQEGLFNTEEASDIYSLLLAIDDPGDPAARMKAWLTPFFGVPLEELASWQEAADSQRLNAMLLRWKRFADAQSWIRLFDDILTNSGLVRRLIFLGEERAMTNYLHLFELLLAETHARPVTLRELSRGLKARIDGRKMPEGREGDIQRLETDREAVQILTMHKAKGLEAEVVFIGGGYGRLPVFNLKKEIYHHNNRRHLHLGKASGEIAAAIEREQREENQRLAYVAVTRARSRLYLPYFGGAVYGAAEKRCYGYDEFGQFYQALQKQLELLRESGRLDDHGYFVFREASCPARLPREKDDRVDLADWPDQELLTPLKSTRKLAEKLEPRHRGILLTSYTRMKRGQGWQPPVYDTDDQSAWRSDEIEGEVLPVEISGNQKAEENMALATSAAHPELPGGREAGIFLHSMLENTRAAEIVDLSFEQWSTLPEVQQRVAAAARRHGFAEQYLPAALEMVYRALKTPLVINSREESTVLNMPGGIITGLHQHAEISFIYPIPEKFHPRIDVKTENPTAGNFDSLPYRVRRGYLQGLIDLVFEYQNKVYLLDWKSDRLEAFDTQSLNAHVDANYSLQARVYTLAIIRLLGIRTEVDYQSRFGGILYLFLRGFSSKMNAQNISEGVWFSRPHWAEIAASEQDFAASSNWGGNVIE